MKRVTKSLIFVVVLFTTIIIGPSDLITTFTHYVHDVGW